MPRSTILERQVTDALNARIETQEQDLNNLAPSGLVPNSSLAEMTAGTIKGRINADGSPQDLTAVEIRQLLIDDAAVSTTDLWSADKITTEVQTAIDNLIDSAPGTLDTLNEIALALQENDSELGALVAQDTQHSSDIAALQTELANGLIYRGTHSLGGRTGSALPSNASLGDVFQISGISFLADGVSYASNGDLIIAEVDNPRTDSLADWGIIRKEPLYATESKAGAVLLAPDGNTTYGVVQATDSRLVDIAYQPDLQTAIEGLVDNAPVEFDTLGKIATEIISAQETINVVDLRGKTNRETLTADKVLTNSDPAIQNLINQSGADLNVSLPATPVADRYFAIINHISSTSNIVVNSVTLLPDHRYEAIFDGTEWIVL